MRLIWLTLLLLGAGLAGMAAQILGLSREHRAAVRRLSSDINGLRGENESLRQQLAAQKILLRQAEAWLEAQRPGTGTANAP